MNIFNTGDTIQESGTLSIDLLTVFHDVLRKRDIQVGFPESVNYSGTEQIPRFGKEGTLVHRCSSVVQGNQTPNNLKDKFFRLAPYIDAIFISLSTRRNL